jgi:hypothetical protein
MLYAVGGTIAARPPTCSTNPEKEISMNENNPTTAHPARTISAFSLAARGYHDAYRAINEHMGDDETMDRLVAEFGAIRDRVFAFRPATMEEVGQKASFLAHHYDDAEGMNDDRMRQLFESLMDIEQPASIEIAA